ncbi:hypothetical protein [Rugosimonospora africana]|uniref:hypothetical protein n=1 Tax=Rugosimonospora africana TaxID=556532 RepID=UPI001941789C|nr:hypothetical protein [Rugosimonospora africana]
MSRMQRRLVVTIVVAFVFGLVVPVVGLALEWYLPLPRRWWSLLLFVATIYFPQPIVFLGVRRLIRLTREIKAERASGSIADQAF